MTWKSKGWAQSQAPISAHKRLLSFLSATKTHTNIYTLTLLQAICTLFCPVSCHTGNNSTSTMFWKIPKHRHSFNFYPTSHWVWSTWEPWGSHQPPRRLFLLERIMTTSWTIHRISNKQTSHWGPSKQHLIILLKSVFCQVHSDFIFWQKHLYAKQDSRHVQARDLIYSAGPQLSSTRWIMPPALETHFPTPTSSFPEHLSWSPDKNSHSKRSNIKNDAKSVFINHLPLLVWNSQKKSRRMTQITRLHKETWVSNMLHVPTLFPNEPLISPQDLHGTFFRSCNCLNKQKTLNSILGSNTTMCFQVVRGFELLHLHFSSLESFHPESVFVTTGEFPTQNLKIKSGLTRPGFEQDSDFSIFCPLTPLGCKCPRWVLIKSTRPN